MFPIVNFPLESESEILNALTMRKQPPSDNMEGVVRKAYNEVAQKGEQAIVEYTREHDHSGFEESGIFVLRSYVEECVQGLDSDIADAIQGATKNIDAVNKKIADSMTGWDMSLSDGHEVGERAFPFEKVLLWAPARKAPLVSTAIMLCSAAAAAGVKQIILATPPGPDGKPNAATIAAGHIAGATDVVCGNALTVIAAAATGNWRHGKVNAVFGPGPDIVALTMLNAARYGLVTQPGIGPSDSLIVFDGITDQEADILARDVLTETEHGKDSYTYALTTNKDAADKLQKALEQEALELFGKDEIYEEVSRKGNAAIVLFENTDAMIGFANEFHPEHLMVYMEEEKAKPLADKLTGAAELLIGKNIPFSAANYCVGITAVLPTNGFARSYSGITSRQFFRHATRAYLSSEAMNRIAPTVEAFGKTEGLMNHAHAATVRRDIS